MKVRLVFIALLCNFLAGPLLAQNGEMEVSGVIPPSPTAASLAMYSEVPVSPYTGIPQINIPLYTIKDQQIEVPISLDYHGGGIKVNQEASWVGLGWSLTSGGVITRVVHGLDDLPNEASSNARGYPDCYTPTSVDPTSNKYITPEDPNEKQKDEIFLLDVVGGQEDPEPDIFYYNFNGHSGKFVLKKRSDPSTPLEVNLISQEDLKIEVQYISSKDDYEWTITDEDGIKYIFGTVETTLSRSGSATDEETADMNAPEGLASEVVTSWYLDRIIAPTGAEINFTYTSPQGWGTKGILQRSEMKRQVTELYTVSGCETPMSEFRYFSTYTEINNVYLESIVFPNGKIEFQLSDRQDIEPVTTSNPTYAKKLDEIRIMKKVGESYSLLKKFDFSYSYFGETSGGYLGQRLKLESFKESNNNSSIPPYTFTYNSLELPAKDSKSIDHWGFYNGAPNNSLNFTQYGDIMTNGTLVPPIRLYIPQSQEWQDYMGADREANPAFTDACILTQIKYPTGAMKEFEYESNDYYSPQEKKITSAHDKFLEKYGDATQIPNYRSDTCIMELSESTEVELSFSVACYSDNPCLEDGEENEYDVASIEPIDGTPGSDIWFGYLLTGENQNLDELKNTVISLPAGKYKFTVYADRSYGSKLFIDWTTTDATMIINNQLGGGLRIKNIKTYADANSSNIQSINYSYNERSDGNGLISSGVLMTKPVYSYQEETIKSCEFNAVISVAKATVRTSYPVYPFSNSALGNPVGYSYVEEIRENNGKTVYEYLNQEDVMPDYPNIPIQSYIGNGLLTNQTIYSNEAGAYKKVEETIKTYKVEGNSGNVIKGMALPLGDASTYITHYLDFGQLMQPVYTNVSFYDVFSDWIHPESDSIITYSSKGDGSYISKTIKYKYDNPNWHQLTEKDVSVNNGSFLKYFYKYPYDYTISGTPNNNTAKGIQNLQNLHIISPVIEQYTQRSNSDGTNLRTIASSFITYKPATPYPDVVNKLEMSQPLTNFQSANINATTATIDSRYKPSIEFDTYDAYGNILQQHKYNDVNHSYLWGYNNVYPIAEAINASSNEIFFDSFEEGSGWDGSLEPVYSDRAITAYDNAKPHAGRASARIDNFSSHEQYSHYNKELNILLSQPTKFKYSGWVYSNGPSADIYFFMKRAGETGYLTYVDYVTTSTTGQWVFLEKEFTVPQDVVKLGIRIDNNGGGQVWFDDIRLHPSSAQMTTYTYAPLVGMTSQTDMNNRTTYYDYDGFGRLFLVRDKDKNILKKYCYNYAGQPEACQVNTTANWQPTGNVRCVVNNNSENTGYQEKEEVDQNVWSASYGQPRWVDNGMNTTACPLPATCSSTCTDQGPEYKCVNGTCDMGYKVFTDSYYDSSAGGYICTYHYEWIDGSWSQDYTQFSGAFPCNVEGPTN